MVNDNNIVKKRKPLGRIIVKIAVIMALVLVFFVIALFSVFNYFKDDISRALLLRLNEKINGRIAFTDITLSPIRFFPDMALSISDLSIAESENEPRIVTLKQVYCAVDVFDLFTSEISISRISIEEGYINLEILDDGTLNIAEIFRKEPEQKKAERETQNKTGSAPDKKPPAEKSFSIDEFSITGVRISGSNRITGNNFSVLINDLNSSLDYSRSRIHLNFFLNAIIDSVIFDGKERISGQPVLLDSDFRFERESGIIFSPGTTLDINGAKFGLQGSLNVLNEGYADINVTGKDVRSSLLIMLLGRNGKEYIKGGKADFRATLTGKTFSELPSISSEFKLSDVSLINPVTKRTIKNLNLSASFLSGRKDDFSQALLTVDTLYADMPDGKIQLSGKLNNFTSPEFSFLFLMDADVTGFNKLLNIKGIDDIRGRLRISDNYKGKYKAGTGKIVTTQNIAEIQFTDFSISIPQAIKLDSVNGIISRKNENYLLNNLRLVYKDTDLLLNGELKNLHYLLFGIEKEILADITIKGPVFNLPEFLFFDPYIKRDFPHRILDVNLSTKAVTTTSKCLNFESFPEIQFDIRRLDATIENFLPRLEIKGGKFTISESILGFNLKLERFKTKFLGGDFNFTGEYNTSRHQPYYIKLNTEFRQIEPGALFASPGDTLSDILSGKLTGTCFADFQFPSDSLVLNFINLKNCNFNYIFSSDTIITRGMNIELSKLHFNSDNPNPLATLTTSGRFNGELLKSSRFRFKDLSLNIKADRGKYELTSDRTRFFGENSQGTSKWVFIPFAEVPSFDIRFNINKFYAEEMLASYMEAEQITGPLSLSLNLSSHGENSDKIISNLNGNFKLNGSNLLFKGLDADKLIDKLQSSQSFDLVDLGGVLLAGPVGLVVTKGTDFARLLTLNPGESTTIIKLVSNWTFKNGEVKTEDAAFTSAKNRFALKGSVNLSADSLNLVIALLDEFGCSTFLQEVYGKSSSPVMGNVKIFSTVAAPVTNLYKDVFGNNCTPFYTGSVKHPVL